MADVIGKSKVPPPPRPTTARCPAVVNGDRMAPTPTKRLLINHGKPNFTIPRTTKKYPTDGNNNVGGSQAHRHANGDHVDRERFRKAFEGQSGKVVSFARVPATTMTTTTTAMTTTAATTTRPMDDNEASRVVLRRTRTASPPDGGERDNKDDAPLPEFIRRQREIQERLAKDNVLDFEKRRSGYFTHVLMSPTSPSSNFFGSHVPSRAGTLPRPQKVVTTPDTDTAPASVHDSNGHADNHPEDDATILALQTRDESLRQRMNNTDEEPEVKNISISPNNDDHAHEHNHDNNNNNNDDNNNNNGEAHLEIQDLAKLKFDIHEDGDEDVQLTPVLRRE